MSFFNSVNINAVRTQKMLGRITTLLKLVTYGEWNQGEKCEVLFIYISVPWENFVTNYISDIRIIATTKAI